MLARQRPPLDHWFLPNAMDVTSVLHATRKAELHNYNTGLGFGKPESSPCLCCSCSGPGVFSAEDGPYLLAGGRSFPQFCLLCRADHNNAAPCQHCPPPSRLCREVGFMGPGMLAPTRGMIEAIPGKSRPAGNPAEPSQPATAPRRAVPHSGWAALCPAGF